MFCNNLNWIYLMVIKFLLTQREGPRATWKIKFILHVGVPRFTLLHFCGCYSSEFSFTEFSSSLPTDIYHHDVGI